MNHRQHTTSHLKLIRSVMLVGMLTHGCVGVLDANEITFSYDPASGELGYTTIAPVTTLEIRSANRLFQGTRPPDVVAPFGVYDPEKLFILNTDGLPPSYSLGPALLPELTAEQIATDFCVNGSVLPSGGLGVASIMSDNGPLPVSGCPPSQRYFLDYKPSTGEMELQFDGVNPPLISTFMLNSESGLFIGPQPASFDGDFDIARPDRLFRLDPEGFDELSLGPIATPGQGVSSLREDLCVVGSLVDGGDLPYIYFPGPSALGLSRCSGVTPPTSGGPGPAGASVTVIYNPLSGNLAVSGDGLQISTLEIVSRDALFVGTVTPGLIQPPFDVAVPSKLFILRTDGFGFVDFGNILEPGLSLSLLTTSLDVQGSVLPSGAIDNVSFRLSSIPEPSSALLMNSAVLGAMVLRRRSAASVA